MMSAQRGAAVLAILALLLVIGSYFILGSLNVAAVRVERDRATNDVLARAREALIAYAASDLNRPGELPCPDVNNDGRSQPIVDYSGSNCVSLVGRLPWFTLGLPDLRDDSGERLWYALSNDFHAGGAVALNNDTAFRSTNTSLALDGMQSASNLVAIVFSPGPPLIREGAVAMQNRSSVANTLDAVNYLDVANSEDNSDADRIFVSSPISERFNDRVLPIHSDDIMWLVERRAGRELSQHLRDHYESWEAVTGTGFYPWAAPFDPPTMQSGASGNLRGSLPLSASPLVWTSASLGCSGVGTSQLTCSGLVLPGLVSINGTIGSIGRGFFEAPSASDFTVVTGFVLLGGLTTSWSVDSAAQSLNFSASTTALGIGLVTVIVRAPAVSPWIGSSWLITNRWYENSYYALAAPFAVNGAGTCGTDCITVANTSSPNDKEAVVVMTGRALSATAPAQTVRPVPAAPPPINQFLERENRSPADLVFESNARTAAFNDLPIAVRP